MDIGPWLVITELGRKLNGAAAGKRGKTVGGRWVGYVAGKRLVIGTPSLPKFVGIIIFCVPTAVGLSTHPSFLLSQ